ncbi:MAG: response regulator, partial [Chloroflexi bacterium]|nr:response regulator [Chloroflexota bacterium]
MRTVLLVEDEVKIVRLARDYLERGGFEVLAASNGEAALATFRAHRPDLAVLDLGLPDMDGLDVLRALRRESNAPV